MEDLAGLARRDPLAEWYDRRISGGLIAYWIYRHIGNLSFEDLRGTRPDRPGTCRGGRGPLLREQMQGADREAGHSRWSFCRDLGRTRLLAIDSRAGRDVTPGARKMVEPSESEWVAGQVEGDFDHLLIPSSVPVFLTHGLHFLEVERGGRLRSVGQPPHRAAERLRQDGPLGVVRLVVRGDHRAPRGGRDRRARAPARLNRVALRRRHHCYLAGHHCYLAEVGFPRGTGAQSVVWQSVCSANRKDLARREKVAMKLRNSDFDWALTRALARSAGVRHPARRLAHAPASDLQQPGRDAQPRARSGEREGGDDRQLALEGPAPSARSSSRS